MVRNRKTKYNPKNKGYIPGEYDVRDKADATIPMKSNMSSDSSFLGKTAFRDLGFAKPITVMANPTAEATRSAVPYAIINGTNPVWEADYPGSSNLAGNTLPLLNNNQKSKMLDNFDCGKIDLKLKYLYAAIKETDINQSLNAQLGKSMSEALAKAYSETYIQMPFFQSTIVSSMKNCDLANRTQAFIWYQTMLQNIAAVPAKYNLCVSLEQHLKDSCYNRDVSQLDDLFGLLRKTSFRSKINAFSNIITGEFFDISWFKQINTLTMVPSRKSNSMRDPLLVIDAIHEVPSLEVRTLTDEVVIDSHRFDVTIPQSSGTGLDGKTLPCEDVIHEVIKMLNPYNILKWARQRTSGLVSTTATDYFNAIVALIEALSAKLNRFSSEVEDIRTVLEVANRAGLNRWKRGIYFDITREMFYQPVFNKLCHDVFVNYLASPNTIYYDDETLRWKFYTLWDEYLGIPKYDKFNGGSFLTFSTRKFEDDVKPSLDTQYLIPKLFDISGGDDSSAEFVNRKGVTAKIGFKVYTAQEINESPIYSRLNSLDFSNYDQRVPEADISEGYNKIPATGSAISYLMNRLFGLGNVVDSALSHNESLNNEIVSIVDIELDDVSNNMIAFAQAYAPFKVYTPTTERTVGFREIPSI